MRNYKDTPDEGELVVVKVRDINPHSAYVDLEEFPDVEGLIHISEVSRSWVRDIRKELDEGEKDVAMVLDHEDNGTVNLSLKRVNDKQKREKMQEWNKERKAEKFIEKVADAVGQDTDAVYEAVAFPFQEHFGNTFDGFEIALVDRDEIADVLDAEYVDAVVDVAEDNISLKQVKMEGELEIQIPVGDGLDKLKEALQTEEGVEISYISAPKYKIEVWGRNQEQAKKRMTSTVEDLEDRVNEAGGSFSFARS